MLAAIDFDDKLCFNADKVGYIWTERRLPLEFKTIYLPIAQSVPKLGFPRPWFQFGASCAVPVRASFHEKDPLILSFSPRGEGTLELSSTPGTGLQRRLPLPSGRGFG